MSDPLLALAQTAAFQAWHLWILGAIALLLLEALLPGFVLLWFGAGALLTAVPAYLGAGPVAQIAAFAGSTFVLLLASRTLLREFLFRPDEAAQVGLEALIGRAGIVEEEAGATGRAVVRVGGERWSARSEEDGAAGGLRAGAEVEVLRVEGASLVVRARSGPFRVVDRRAE